MFTNFDEIWYTIIYSEFKKPYFKSIFKYLNNQKKIIYPNTSDIFNAFKITRFNNINVVILGQDPYCKERQAQGLAFSVPENITLPSSLKNIYQELYHDTGIIKSNKNGSLFTWANQGVLLLNSILTVEQNRPGSHTNIGWEILTDKIIRILSNNNKKIIFVLLGKHALNKIKLININKNIIISTTHPSNKSANKGFFGSRIFSKINLHLKLLGSNIINW